MREMTLTIGPQRFVRVKEENESLYKFAHVRERGKGCTCEGEGEGVHV